MVVLHLAYTEKINPDGATPVLTRDQIWKGLQRKIRHAEDFVPVIEKTDVLEDGESEVLRRAYFKAMGGKPAMQVEERCKSYYPTKIDFVQPDGAIITNTISEGEGLTEHDYHMTYTFEWRMPEVEDGSAEHKEQMKAKIQLAKGAVHSSIVAMRAMASKGELN